jgi:hypothetical protein
MVKPGFCKLNKPFYVILAVIALLVVQTFAGKAGRAIAHIKWSVSPFTVDASISQLIYAFAIGTVQGMAYQESRSVLYPILMHSVSNVLMVGTGYLFAVLA